MSTTTKTQVTDFTLREPKLPLLHLAYEKESLAYALKNETWRSQAQIRADHKKYSCKWVKIELTKDIVNGAKVVARKGDIAWAIYNPASTNVSIMVHRSWSKTRIEAEHKKAKSANYHVRIPSTRKLASRPSWKGELASIHYRCELNEVKEI